MQGIFRKENTDKALKYGIYRHLPTYEKIIRNLVSFYSKDRFTDIHGLGEGNMLTFDGTPLTVKIFKKDSVDSNGTLIWVMAIRVDWEHENITLINEVLKSGFWYMDCDNNGNIREVHWSHTFRKMLGYRDILDFPNRLGSWSDLLHPDDKKKTFNSLYAAIKDKTNKKKYDVEYRLKVSDGSYSWFRASAEIIRRTDGTARRITGIFVNIDDEKEAQLQRKRKHFIMHLQRLIFVSTMLILKTILLIQ